MSKILVTGGAGFIGSWVASRLLDRGEEIIIIDDFNGRYDPRLKEARVRHFFARHSQAIIIRGDIRDQALIKQTFAKYDIDRVIHLAAWAAVPTSLEKPEVYVSVNVDGTLNLLEASRQHHIKHFVFASSSSVYGGRTHVPFRESDDISRPISPYAATKVAGESLCYTWHHLYQTPITCLRFFTVYGPWGRPEMAVFKFTEAILKGDTIILHGRGTERDFTYIDDCVAGVIAALDHPTNFAIFNLGESDSVPLPRLISALESATGRSANIQFKSLTPGEVPRTLADISLAQERLGYHPVTTIETGTEHFVRWYLDWYVPNYIN